MRNDVRMSFHPGKATTNPEAQRHWFGVAAGPRATDLQTGCLRLRLLRDGGLQAGILDHSSRDDLCLRRGKARHPDGCAAIRDGTRTEDVRATAVQLYRELEEEQRAASRQAPSWCASVSNTRFHEDIHELETPKRCLLCYAPQQWRHNKSAYRKGKYRRSTPFTACHRLFPNTLSCSLTFSRISSGRGGLRLVSINYLHAATALLSSKAARSRQSGQRLQASIRTRPSPEQSRRLLRSSSICCLRWRQ